MKQEKNIEKIIREIQLLRRKPLTPEQVENINKAFEKEVEQERLKEKARKIAVSPETEV